jgi:hypothetical protein
MTDLLTRIIENVLGRLVGPLTFRFFLQPAMATFLAVRAGIEDARLNRPAYLWAVFSNPAHRRSLLRDGWKDIAKLFTAAVVLDAIYQIIARRWIYPGEAVLVAVLLAVVPYVAVRGPVTRIVRATMSQQRGRA